MGNTNTHKVCSLGVEVTAKHEFRFLVPNHLVDEDVTDDSTMVELIGNPVSVFPGDPNNIKISSQSDLVFLELIITGQKNNERN